jgi:vacuolar-type H+-ATPase subunit E/Vma4
MAIEHLVAALESEAEARIRSELQAAREEAARIEREASDRIARLRAEALQERQVQFQQEAERTVAATRREARQKLLLARHRLLDRVLRRAGELAPAAARSPAYLAGLAEDLACSMSYIGQSGAVVRCSPALAAEVRPLLAGHREWQLEVDSALAPGFEVAAANGSVVVDRTLPRRLLLEEARLRLEILRELGEP